MGPASPVARDLQVVMALVRKLRLHLLWSADDAVRLPRRPPIHHRFGAGIPAPLAVQSQSASCQCIRGLPLSNTESSRSTVISGGGRDDVCRRQTTGFSHEGRSKKFTWMPVIWVATAAHHAARDTPLRRAAGIWLVESICRCYLWTTQRARLGMQSRAS